MPSRIEVVNGSTRTRSSERIALGFLLQEPAVIFDHQVFRRIGADRVARRSGCAHSPGNFSFLRGLSPTGFSRCLGRGSRRRMRSRLGVDPDFSRREIARSPESGGFLLRQIAVGHLPHFPGVVVVHHRARGDRQIEDAGDQVAADLGQVARVARQSCAAASVSTFRR